MCRISTITELIENALREVRAARVAGDRTSEKTWSQALDRLLELFSESGSEG